MTTLMVQLDSGLTVPLRECDWVFYHACGCPRGVTTAVIGATVLHDEDTAWRDFFDQGYKRETEAAVRRERKRGVTSRLMTHGQYSAEVRPAMTAKCPHALAAGEVTP
jgi:hypothetical protein